LVVEEATMDFSYQVGEPRQDIDYSATTFFPGCIDEVTEGVGFYLWYEHISDNVILHSHNDLVWSELDPRIYTPPSGDGTVGSLCVCQLLQVTFKGVVMNQRKFEFCSSIQLGNEFQKVIATDEVDDGPVIITDPIAREIGGLQVYCCKGDKSEDVEFMESGLNFSAGLGRQILRVCIKSDHPDFPVQSITDTDIVNALSSGEFPDQIIVDDGQVMAPYVSSSW